MKNKYIFLMLVAYALVSCKGESEEELVGDWERRQVFMDCGRAHAAYFVIENCGYVVGGTNGNRTPLNDVYKFDPNMGTEDLKRKGIYEGVWYAMKTIPAEMPARQQAVGFSLPVGGKWYGFVGTGYSLDASGRDLITMKDFWRFCPVDTVWTEVAPLPTSAKPRRGAFAFSLQVGGKWYGYVGCGYEDEPGRNYLADLWRYDPETNTWAAENNSVGKRAGATVFVIDNKAYISTGTDAGTIGNITDFYVFDPNATEENQKWKKLRKMDNANPDLDYDDDYATLKRAFGVGFVVKVGDQFRGHIVGGSVSSNTANWEYDQDEDLWMQRTSFYNRLNRHAREGMVSFSFPELGRAFVGLGRSGIAFFDEFWEFFPMENDDIYSDIK